LDNAILVLETTEFLGFTIAAMTVHLTFPSGKAIVKSHPQDV
jgi:hypothetical protein